MATTEIKVEEVEALEVHEGRSAAKSVAKVLKKIEETTHELSISDFLTNDLVTSIASVCSQILVLKKHGPTSVETGHITLGCCGNGAFSFLPGYQRHTLTTARIQEDMRSESLNKVRGVSKVGDMSSPIKSTGSHFVTDLSIAEAFVLIWHNEVTGQLDGLHSGITIPTILYGCVLAELLLISKLGIDPHEHTSFGIFHYSHANVKVNDNTPLGSAAHPKFHLDAVLEEIAEHSSSHPPRPLKSWIEMEFQSQSSSLAFSVLDCLVHRKILQEQEGKKWGFIPISTYKTLDPKPYEDIREEIRKVLLEDKEPDLFVQVLLQFVRRADLAYAFWKNPFLERLVEKEYVNSALIRLVNITQWAA